ncbi:hypothetical protein GCM10022231_04080 [Gordonia caeni]|uniref:DUF3068 domain-containing protein n=2 Tax=Gordonia caeni TaxID=1007097 RepID=A0ABP7NLC5_9ACTN
MALLAFLGIACIAAAITIPTYLVPKLKVVPLDLDITSDASTVSDEGQAGERFPAVIFDRCSVSESKAAQLNVNLRQQRRSIIVEPSNADQATLQSAQTVLIERVEDADGAETTPTVAAAGDERTCSDGLLTANIDRVSVDRQTSAPNGDVSSLQLEADPEGVPVEDVSVRLDDRKGFQYKFGFGVQQRDYYYYDLNTRQDTVASFVEEKTIDGLDVYHFKTEVPETDLSDLPNPQDEAPLGTILNMPAKWWGISGRGVRANDLIEMHRFGAAVRHVYVEPVTGTIVDGYEEQHQYFRSVDDSEDAPAAIRDFRMDALKANFKWSDTTVSQQVARADKYVGQLRWGGTYVPIILGVLGALFLLGWGWLFFRGRKDDAGTPADPDTPDDGTPGDHDYRPAAAGAGAAAAGAAAAPTEYLGDAEQTTEFGGEAPLRADEYWAPGAAGEQTTGLPPIDPTADTVAFEPLPDLTLPPMPAAPADDFGPLDLPDLPDLPDQPAEQTGDDEFWANPLGDTDFRDNPFGDDQRGRHERPD